MRVIPTRIHGMIDYLMGVLLIVAPYLLGFADGAAAQYVPQLLGIGIIGLALVTDFELGIVRAVPMPVHLIIDMLGGALLLASPWLFGFAAFVFWPHVILGVAEICLALLTRTTPTTVPASVRDTAH